jgi:hypothetical protein
LKRIGLVAVAFLTMLCSEAFAQPKKALFFEAALAPADTTFSAEPAGYSKLTGMLRDAGMLVASMTSGDITQQKLSPYDIVVLHPSPERPFREDEVSALVWFVVQKGGAVFVHGGTAKIVNPFVEIFGVSMDASDLVDVTSAMKESPAGRKFALTRFPVRSGFELGDVKTIGFYGGAPLVLSRDAVEVVTGDEDCYSDNGLYSIGSLPPVAAVAYVGRGVLFVKSDRTMLSNAYIDAYQNAKWMKTVFARLAAAGETELERDRSLFGLRSQVKDLEGNIKVSAEKQTKYETDLTASYEKVKGLQSSLQAAEKKNEDLTAQLNTLETERNKLLERLDIFINPDNLKAAAIGAGAVLLVVFLGGIYIGRRTMRGRV